MEEINAWLARDECGDLYLYIFEKPRKVNVDWLLMELISSNLEKKGFPKFNGRTKSRQRLNL